MEQITLDQSAKDACQYLTEKYNLTPSEIIGMLLREQAHFLKGQGAPEALTSYVPVRDKILAALDADEEPLSPLELATSLQIEHGAVRTTLHRLLGEGRVKRTGYGQYILLRA